MLSSKAKLSGRTTAIVALEPVCDDSFFKSLYIPFTSCRLDDSADLLDAAEKPESTTETVDTPSE